MRLFWKCFAYFALIGTIAHFVGLGLSRLHFSARKAPWRSAKWEQDGRFWDRTLHVRRWMNRLPDMSRIMPDMAPKRLMGKATPGKVAVLIRETCVAELVHWLLILFGFECVTIWPGTGGWVMSLLYALGNLPFIMIQRYNRPRFVRLHAWLSEKQAQDEAGALYDGKEVRDA